VSSSPATRVSSGWRCAPACPSCPSSYGSHHAVVILSRGERLARALGLNKLRIKVFPIVLGPFGVSSILTPPLPMPAAVTVEFMTPIDWSSMGPATADDDDTVVDACYEQITSAMQATLDRLHRRKPPPRPARLVPPPARRRLVERTPVRWRLVARSPSERVLPVVPGKARAVMALSRAVMNPECLGPRGSNGPGRDGADGGH
jgi:hypothetical protein